MIIATIQARLGSKRLPKKVIADVSGLPLIVQMYNRVKASKLIHKVVVVTTTSSIDNELVDLCDQYSIPTFRGSESMFFIVSLLVFLIILLRSTLSFLVTLLLLTPIIDHILISI